MNEWAAWPQARQVRAERLQMRRTERGGLVKLRVRGYAGVVMRRMGGRVEQQKCPHTHSKQSSAVRCAESLAKQLNG